VGFKVGYQGTGLDPNGHKHGMTPYFNVGDIKSKLKLLKDVGSQVQQEIKDVGGGKLIASVKDPDGNVIGLAQEP
jgi:predicted enzyme related to lactoylglutathione lyase